MGRNIIKLLVLCIIFITVACKKQVKENETGPTIDIKGELIMSMGTKGRDYVYYNP